MGQINFQIGIPRAGSAARNAEEEERIAPTVGRIALPRAGSAARSVEEEKAVNGSETRPHASFSLRAQNGVITRNRPVTSTEFNPSGVQTAPPEAPVPHDAPTSPSVSTSPLETGRGDVSAQSPAGPLQLAASRFQALVRSLFTSSEASGKS